MDTERQNKDINYDNKIDLESEKNYNIDILSSQETYILLDFETNSSNANDVLEVAGYKLIYDENKYRVIDTFHRYYFSKHPYDLMAQSIHNLTPKRIERLRTGAKYVKYFVDDIDFIEFCKSSNTLIAHNISFELRYIGKLVNFEHHFCTMKENKNIVKALNKRGHLKNPKLIETLNHYNISFSENELHGALYDISKTLEVLNCMNIKENNYHVIQNSIYNNIVISNKKEKKVGLKKETQLMKSQEKKEKSITSQRKRNLWLQNIECPKCLSKNIHKKDKRERKSYWIQRYQCMDCKSIFQKKIEENNNEEFIKSFNFNGLIPTVEQKEILLSLEKYEIIKINAFAGTGKTLTLQMLTTFYTQKSFLYLAYNKSIQLEAEKKFGQNVEVKTIHSIAYQMVSSCTNLNLKNIINYSPKQIATLFNVNYKKANEILSSFDIYCQLNLIKHENKEKNTSSSKSLVINTNPNTEYYVKKMIEKIENHDLAVSFTYILKKFHLLLSSGFDISAYDVIMLDEAQDSNDVILEILKLLRAKHKILVGDKHQQIYGFNGSINSMKKINGKEFVLTKTFRLSKDVMEKANHLLEYFKGEEFKIKTDKDNYNFNEIHNDLTKNIAYISRGNASLLSKMKDLSIKKEKYKTIRHPKEIFLLLKDIAYFFAEMKENISNQHAFLKKLKNENDFIDYFINAKDTKLETHFRIYELIFSKSLTNIEALEKEAINYFNSNDSFRNILTTAHSAKGLEFDIVIISNDFETFSSIICKMGYPLYDNFIEDIHKNYNNQILEEFNIFYVAITRSKFVLSIDNMYLKYFDNDWVEYINSDLYALSSNAFSFCYNKKSKKDKTYVNDNISRFKSTNPYDILGLESTSSKVDIKIAYRKLMKIYHPDLTQDKKEEYTHISKKINWAYSELK